MNVGEDFGLPQDEQSKDFGLPVGEEASSLASRFLAAARDESAEYGRDAGQVQQLMGG